MGEFLTTAVLGAVVGSLFALLAFGIVLTYRTTGIFNFAQGAMGMLFAFVFFQLTQGGRVFFLVGSYEQTWTLPVVVALPLTVLVLAPLSGWFLDRILFRRLRTAETHIQIVSTIGLLIAIQGVVAFVWTSSSALRPTPVFPTDLVQVGTFTTPVSRFLTLGLIVMLAVGLLVFLRRAHLGVQMRAVVDRADLAELMGINSARVSSISWGLSMAFAALAGILITPELGGSLDIQALPFMVVPATAAAIVGALRSLPITLLAGVGIGIARTASAIYLEDVTGAVIQATIPFMVLFVALLLPFDWREVRPAVGGGGAGADGGSKPKPFGPGALIATGVGLLVLPLLPFVRSLEFELARVPAYAIMLLGLVVLVGYAGQISLAHASLAGIGAFVAARLVADAGVPFLLAALIAALITVVPAVLLAWRATRLSPLFLGLATLAFGSLVDAIVLNVPSVTNNFAGVPFSRPAILEGPYALYVAGLVVFGLFALVLRNVKVGATGLALVAMRDSSVAAAGTGQSLARLKLIVFSLSALIAGIGGAMIAGTINRASPTDYLTFLSLIFLAVVVVGGVRTPTGALVGAALFVLTPELLPAFFEWLGGSIGVEFQNAQELRNVFFGAAAIGLANNPGGITAQSRAGWNATIGRLLDRGGPATPSSVAASKPFPTHGTWSPAAALDRGLDGMTRKELYAIAQQRDIPGRSSMSREELIEALRYEVPVG